MRIHDHAQTHYTTKDSSGRGICPSQRLLPENKQDFQETDINNAGGIQTRNLSKRASSNPWLSPRGHWDPIKPNHVKESVCVWMYTYRQYTEVFRFRLFFFHVTSRCTFKTQTKYQVNDQLKNLYAQCLVINKMQYEHHEGLKQHNRYSNAFQTLQRISWSVFAQDLLIRALPSIARENNFGIVPSWSSDS